jgi:hypothetical protein
MLITHAYIGLKQEKLTEVIKKEIAEGFQIESIVKTPSLPDGFVYRAIFEKNE